MKTPTANFHAVDQTDGEAEPVGFVLVLKPIPGWRTSPIQRLRASLKVLLRGFGLKCVHVTQHQPKKGESSLEDNRARTYE